MSNEKFVVSGEQRVIISASVALKASDIDKLYRICQDFMDHWDDLNYWKGCDTLPRGVTLDIRSNVSEDLRDMVQFFLSKIPIRVESESKK